LLGFNRQIETSENFQNILRPLNVKDTKKKGGEEICKEKELKKHLSLFNSLTAGLWRPRTLRPRWVIMVKFYSKMLILLKIRINLFYKVYLFIENITHIKICFDFIFLLIKKITTQTIDN
jgi:hypothetical protein